MRNPWLNHIKIRSSSNKSLTTLNLSNGILGIWCGPAQKHQQGPITCSKWSNDSVQDKGIERGMNVLVLNVSTKSEFKGPLEYQEETLVHLIHVQEGSNTTFFGPWGEDSKGNKRILLQLGNNMGGYLFLLLLGLRGWKAIHKLWISSIIFYFLLFFS